MPLTVKVACELHPMTLDFAMGEQIENIAEVPLVVDGTPVFAEELYALCARWVVDRVTEREGEPPAVVTLTHPASWGDHRLALVRDALADAGRHGVPDPHLHGGLGPDRLRAHEQQDRDDLAALRDVHLGCGRAASDLVHPHVEHGHAAALGRRGRDRRGRARGGHRRNRPETIVFGSWGGVA